MRVDAWYRKGELAPQPELSDWRLHPEARLRELACDLREGHWQPEAWLQIPYPKKGGRLRHYMMPTVRDQVAFMAHMILLGPIIDDQMPTFAFGNRWYRRIAWDRRDTHQWVQKPYPILSDKVYLPYARSYGLFRRVAHWTVARMTGANVPDEDYVGPVRTPRDYKQESLPPWTQQQWWQGRHEESRAYWAALDIELAYPSVYLDRLGKSIEQALSKTLPVEPAVLLDGCPETVSMALEENDVRISIGRLLVTALKNVRIKSTDIPRDAWAPPQNHPLPKVYPDKDLGLPTGLAISGVLLNVALLDADKEVERYLQETEDGMRGAIVRFADDMYVLSQSVRGLFSLIETVHRALSGTRGAKLATANWDSNLCLNIKKIEPGEIREVISHYLIDNGWQNCGIEGCGQPLPDKEPFKAESGLDDWWKGGVESENFSYYKEKMERTSIGKGDVGPFVTSLVERLSEVGTDTLRQRFGEGAREHLVRLHELARFDIGDEQVREDTRRAFSVNRLVRAWLPLSGPQYDESKEIAEIRETVAFVLSQTPWKFSLWRAAVRASVRRPLGDQNDGTKFAAEAEEWLSNQLRHISSNDDDCDSTAWASTWPEEDVEKGHGAERDGSWRQFYLSFVRTAFWHALADTILDLGRHANRFENNDEEKQTAPPNLWTTRVVREGGHAGVAESLSNVDKWLDILYPLDSDVTFRRYQWELDALLHVVLSVHKSSELAKAWRCSLSPGRRLVVPLTERLTNLPKTVKALRTTGLLQETKFRRNRKLDRWALANVQLGLLDEQLSGILFPAANRVCIRQGREDPSLALVAGFALGCFKQIPLRLANQLTERPNVQVEAFKVDRLKLREYSIARRVILGHEVKAKLRQPTLHRLLWGTRKNDDLQNWSILPWETPELGLPSLVAATLLKRVGAEKLPTDWKTSPSPLTWRIDDPEKLLARGRRVQFDECPNELGVEDKDLVKVTRSAEWEVLPHAAFFLPFISVDVGAIHADSYMLYCDALLFLTALDGGERILDGLARWSVRDTPLEDRWAWRSRIHLPRNTWQALDKLLRWAERPSTNATRIGYELRNSLDNWLPEKIQIEDFQLERVDIGLPIKSDKEVVRIIRSASQFGCPPSPVDLQAPEECMGEKLVVRVGQVAAWLGTKDVVSNFPRVPFGTSHTMIEQVVNVFSTPAQTADGMKPELVVLPELAVPLQEVNSLRDLVKTTEIGALAGLYWRQLKPPYQPSGNNRATRKYFVNEAELVLPIRDVGRGPTEVRWFRVRKPVPAHMEDGLASAMSKKSSGVKWIMLRGKRWYRFVDSKWGDFTIAICADLIDALPWRTLRGEILHLLMVAYNKDVDLFESLTWVRAYENYVNVTSVNHGKFGGSFIWTPRSRHERELARLRGNELTLLADVALPVKGLLDAQKKGLRSAVIEAKRYWLGKKSFPGSYKAVPPGFEGRE